MLTDRSAKKIKWLPSTMMITISLYFIQKETKNNHRTTIKSAKNQIKFPFRTAVMFLLYANERNDKQIKSCL